MKSKKRLCLLPLILALCAALSACGSGASPTSVLPSSAESSVRQETPSAGSDSFAGSDSSESAGSSASPSSGSSSSRAGSAGKSSGISLKKIPAYSGTPYVEINKNRPAFSKKDLSRKTSYQKFSPLDTLGRCGKTVACIGPDLLPHAKRGPIGSVRPSGWHTVKYPRQIRDRYLYNRCHLIAYELTGQNANEKNLITGTRYLNIEGMLPFENKVTEYIRSTGNHVLYRVTPIFKGRCLVASGVEMEARSIEDKGKGISFHVYCYNVQPGITIDYRDGSSRVSGSGSDTGTVSPAGSAKKSSAASKSPGTSVGRQTYVLNTNTRKFHLPSCSSIARIKPSNKKKITARRSELIREGYDPCGICAP